MNPAYTTVDHVFTVPLDHSAPEGEDIQVFAREVVDPARAGERLPWLLYLQGGPGGKSPRPSAGSPGWLDQALTTHRVLLLDQRGTGRSTPVTARAAARFASPAQLAAYLGHFRADSIVADAELIRRQLCEDEPWETLGQSYGGFLTLTYLSRAPEGLRACYVTGGLPGLTATADDVYARTYPRVRDRVLDFYARYPDDAARLRRIADLLAATEVRLPDGDRLTTRRLRTLGLALGMGDGFERLHWLLDESLDTDGELTDTFLHQVRNLTGFTDNPLYAVLQETLYGQGAGPTDWAASRALDGLAAFTEEADPLLLTGEMIYPWMFREITGLRPFADAADLLAARADWPPLYDPHRLAANQVPLAAIVYHDDMYVDAGLSLRTAREVGATRAWVTNEWEHDGVSASGGRVLSRLMDLAAGRA
ncbi:alpha/beta hydrolase [Streptomyces sp. Je 1-4]|uniref:alpha/beta hydrolase n=1 Tax=Streptomyces TaxID=1883 RepID=UPI0021D94045|nr:MULTISPECIES: alpha/beta hydrolase [unclassified Streptomyces]UYB38010.1 alpha/beta hydrolase [Streptomyces sp. Je 1-4]UZQ33942.1 alpha/beta hydrolase [Streptomyces sp. Je 1-4] [Streptomyces sp. Je 1-4 4N24]UZQ41360.1 alpha/beta hydrolase [Streptomyces sp. Je 1-4] [Streptomyces sp. Je 1-4 4N24_ara]